MRSIVLFSGGLDSYATLVLAREVSETVACVHVRYGQPHGEQELAAALALVEAAPLFVLDAPTLAKADDVFAARNPILLALAASVAVREGADTVWAGFCRADAEAFPDCRPAFIEAQERALRLALGAPYFAIIAPLLDKSKADTFRLLDGRGLEHQAMRTHTCYEGDRTPRPWGTGCARCSACRTRLAGWVAAYPGTDKVADRAASAPLSEPTEQAP